MRSRWLAPAVLALMWAAAMIVYPHLPERVPLHWNLQGEVDRWGGRGTGAFLPPVIATFVYLLMTYVPRIDPRKRNIDRLGGDYALLVSAVILFMALLQGATTAVALGVKVNIGAVVLAGVGALWVAIGNYLPRVRQNFTVGVRTPWTLSSEAVWRETHRIAGRSMVVGGLLTIGAALLPDPARGLVAIVTLLSSALLPVAWSYVLWRRGGVNP
jgi:uncharacterized membrane protein